MPHPICLTSGSWSEVIRIAQPSESGGTYYYHAPGSGVWLFLGRTACCNNKVNFDRDAFDRVYGQRFSPDRRAVGFGHMSTDPQCRLDLRSLSLPEPAGSPDTVQRRGNTGNLLEIIVLLETLNVKTRSI